MYIYSRRANRAARIAVFYLVCTSIPHKLQISRIKNIVEILQVPKYFLLIPKMGNFTFQ